MEDDELADRTQQLLDALDTFLSNGRLTAQLELSELNSLRTRRRQIGEMLTYYRSWSGYTKRRTDSRRIVPAVSQQAMLLPAALGGVAVLAPATTGAGAGTAATVGMEAGGWAVAGTVGMVLLPIAAALLISEITGGSIQQVAGRNLMNAANALMRDLLELGTLAVLMAITAEEAARLSTDELLKQLLKAVGGAKTLAAEQILLAELIKRFPKCLGAITGLKQASLRLRSVRASFVQGRYGELMMLGRAQAAAVKAGEALKACIASSSS